MQTQRHLEKITFLYFFEKITLAGIHNLKSGICCTFRLEYLILKQFLLRAPSGKYSPISGRDFVDLCYSLLKIEFNYAKSPQINLFSFVFYFYFIKFSSVV